MAAKVFTRSARKWPSSSSASSASVTLSRACASLRKASVRVLIHFTGRPMILEASSTSGVSLKIGDFMRKLHRRVDGVAAVSGVVVANCAAWLYGGGCDTVDDEAVLHNAGCARKGG